MKARYLLFLAPLLFPVALSFGSITEGGSGIVYGDDHAFSLKAPKGWMLDNESAVSQGVHAVFYPKGSTWRDSIVVAYARARPRTEEIATADAAAKEVIADFHAKGSPKYEGKYVKTLKTKSGEAVVYHFSGDEWGNSEAAAYFVEAKTINFITLTSRNRKVFEDSLPAFEQLAASYTFIGDTPNATSEPLGEKFAAIHARAHEMGETEEGKTYEKKFGEAFARALDASHPCTDNAKLPSTLNLVFAISADGMVQRIVSKPQQQMSACTAKRLNRMQAPPPPRPNWLVAVNFTITE